MPVTSALFSQHLLSAVTAVAVMHIDSLHVVHCTRELLDLLRVSHTYELDEVFASSKCWA